MSDLLPVLVADLADERARDFLHEVARNRGEAWVPLVAAPADASLHLLEVYTPGDAEPLRLLAEPIGPPGRRGFPIRLSVLEEGAVAAPLQAPAEERVARRVDTPTLTRMPGVQAARETPISISAEHEAELAGEGPASRKGEEPNLVGRTLGGGKLLVEALIGEGALGAVYRARHSQLNVPVAVKVLHSSFQEDVDFCRRFYSEALAASRLDHPNLIRVYDFGQEPDGLLYISMEYLQGTTLRGVLERGGPMAAARIAEVMLQVCAGLGHAHARGIVHRDVRPENVLLVAGHDDDGRLRETVKVGEFGIALLKSKGGEQRERLLRATPEYMSPEQCRGEDLDARSDIYACGVVLYELAAGHVPFRSDKPIVTVNRHLSMPPPPLADSRPDVDPRLELIVQRALRKNRAERYGDMRALRADLKMLLRPATPGDIALFEMSDEARMAANATPAAGMSSIPPAVTVSSIPPAPRALSSRPPMPSLTLPPPAPQTESIPRAAAVPAGGRVPGSSAPPARAPSNAPARRPASSAPGWLEERSEGYEKFFTGLTADGRPEDLAETLSRDPVRWLGRLASEQDALAFGSMMADLEVALKKLARRGDARALWAISSTLHGIATESPAGTGSRAARAASVMRWFSDPGLLSPIAERLLEHDDEAARTLLRGAGVAGTYALYGARVKLAANPSARAPFVATMRLLGEAAWPVVRAALERIPEAALTGEHPLAADLAEDLLYCVPVVRDEAAGHLAVKYVRAKVPGLCRAACGALVRLWADRAQPVLLGLLGDVDDGVRAAALLGLREVGAVDTHVVRRLAGLVRRPDLGLSTPLASTSPDLRLAVVCALEGALPDARPLALQLLAEIVRESNSDPETVVAAARALLSVAGDRGRAVVSERAAHSSEPLRTLLRTISAA